MCVGSSFAPVSIPQPLGLCPTAAVCPPPLPPGPAPLHPTSAAVVPLLHRPHRDAQAAQGQWKHYLRGAVAGGQQLPRSRRLEVSSAHTAPPRPPSVLNPPRAPNLLTETHKLTTNKRTDAHPHTYQRVGGV
eukprot:GHVU01176992.1.p1 GENE.GHVU01176992.1~~GHVU01176992.1.p1  ORF type:complete len:132 (-),score=5.57 GHVU01176992.1:8-403(-)